MAALVVSGSALDAARRSCYARPGRDAPSQRSRAVRRPPARPGKERLPIQRPRRGPLAFGHEVLALLALLLGAGVVSGPALTLLPVYLERDLTWAPPAIAALAGARFLAGALSAPLGGALADAAGARLTLWLGLASLPLAALIFLTPVAPALVLLILAAGLADGLQATGGQAYLVAHAKRATIGLATGAFFVGNTLGGALGNLGAGALLREWGFAGLGWAGLVAGLVVFAAARALPAGVRSPRARRPALAGALAGYRPLLGVPAVRQLALLRFLSTCSWGAATFLWPLLIARLGGDPAAAALFGAVSLVVAVAAQLGAGRLIDVIGPGGPAVALAGLAPLLVASSALALAARSLPALFIIGVAGTSAAWSLSGTIPPLIHAAVPAGQVGQVVGLLHLLWSLAMLTGTLLAGWLVAIHPALPFGAVALLILPIVAAALRLRGALRPTRRDP